MREDIFALICDYFLIKFNFFNSNFHAIRNATTAMLNEPQKKGYFF